MAANYWASTQRRHWLFTREKLADVRDRLREQDKVAHSQYQLPDQRLLNIYFNQRMFAYYPLGRYNLTRGRINQAWKAHVYPPTGHRNCAGLSQAFLYKE